METYLGNDGNSRDLFPPYTQGGSLGSIWKGRR